MVGSPVDVGNPGCHKPTMTGDGWNPTHKNGDDLGMAYEIWVYHITPIPLKNTQRHSVHLWGFTHLWDHRTGCLRLGFIKSYGYYNMCKWYYTHGNSPRMARKVIVFTPGKSIRIWWLEPHFPRFQTQLEHHNTKNTDTTGTLEHVEQRSWKLKCYHITHAIAYMYPYVPSSCIIVHVINILKTLKVQLEPCTECAWKFAIPLPTCSPGIAVNSTVLVSFSLKISNNMATLCHFVPSASQWTVRWHFFYRVLNTQPLVLQASTMYALNGLKSMAAIFHLPRLDQVNDIRRLVAGFSAFCW